MNLFLNDRLNPDVFDLQVRQTTGDLSKVLMAATRTQSRRIESTHILMALSEAPRSLTASGLASRGLTTGQWQSGLDKCAEKASDFTPLLAFEKAICDDSAIRTLEEAAGIAEQLGQSSISEAVLLSCALRLTTPSVRELCSQSGVGLETWIKDLERLWRPAVAVSVFEIKPPHRLILDSFAPDARAVLDLVRTEAESLGADLVDARHLLLALLGREGGASAYGLFLQGIQPRQVHEALILNMRPRPGAVRSGLPLDRDHLQPLLHQMLEFAGELAGRKQSTKITEPILLNAFLEVESAARRILLDQGVNLDEFRRIAGEFEPPKQKEDHVTVMADIQTIETRLRQRIVGQEDAIRRILPHIQRFRFGFRAPHRPVGVFLFCGQSGSGKTEMAKELARAVFGSEDNLLFLEMGQFNSPESMNIFVGAPPGYVGYGEGKLTNGLRDKPQAVVLFDEIEKAHARVLDALLRFLDEGVISDPAGPVRDGSQCLVVLTSNVGAEQLGLLWQELENHPQGRSIMRQKLREEFKKHFFRVEFLNRVDELVLFRTLREGDYIEITRRHLQDELSRMQKDHGIEVLADPSVATEIGSWCFKIGEGARAAHRLVRTVVITPVIDRLMRIEVSQPVTFRVRAVRQPEDEPEGVVEICLEPPGQPGSETTPHNPQP